MKKIVNLLFATAVAALALVSCQKKEMAVDVNENEAVEPPIHFYATEIATKTVFDALSAGEYPTLWTNSKNIKISYNKKASVEATVTPKSGGTQADFTPESAFTPSGDSHVFYAMSPATAQGANISTSAYSWRFIIPASQTPLDNSVDEDAQLIYAKFDAGATFPTSVPLAFSHLTAYGKLSFSGLALDGDEEISSITLTASKDWVGQYFYYVATKDPNTEGDFKPRESYVSKKITLATNKSSDIWFACAPVDLSNGGTIDINVFTNKGVFAKKITFPSGKGNFQKGRVGAFAVDMSAVSRTAVVNNIAAIKALYSSADVPFVANLTDALVTVVSGNNFYLQDASGAILGFTSGHGLAEGDKLNGLISGTVTKYQSNFEITGFDSSASKTTGNTVTPTTVAHATLVEHFADYESEYVKVDGLTVSAVSGKDITVSDNANLKIRNESTTVITVGTQLNAVGVACYYNSTKQVKVFTIADSDLIKIGSVINADDKSVDEGGTVSIGASSNSPATITYASSDETVATVNASGVVTGVKAGSATITCSVAASGKYLAASKDITVTVNSGSSIPSPVTTNTYSNVATVSGSGAEQTATWTNGDITISAVRNDSKNTTFRSSDSDHTRFYKGWTITVSSAAHTISSVEFTCTSNDYASTLAGYTFTNGSGAASESVVTVSSVSAGSTAVTLGAQIRISSIRVTYSE